MDKQLEGIVIPCVEEEYFEKLGIDVATFSSMVGKDRKESEFIRNAFYFFREGFRVLQIITDDCSVIKKIKKITDGLTIIGGGNINSVEKAINFLNNQSDYIIVGKFLAKNPTFVKEWTKIFKKRLIVSIDDNKGYLTGNKSLRVETYVKLLSENKVQNIIYVDEDTKLTGKISPNRFGMIKNIMKKGNVIYSGGVSSLQDVEVLKNRGADSVIVGSALYNGKMHYTDVKNIFV